MLRESLLGMDGDSDCCLADESAIGIDGDFDHGLQTSRRLAGMEIEVLLGVRVVTR